MNLDQRFNLEGKVAVVIGGAGHLCSTLSKAFIESGVKVIVLDVANTAPSADDGATYMRCDVASKPELSDCSDEIIRKFSHVDILLNGAGAQCPDTFL